MPFYHGSQAGFKLDNNAGSLQDLSAYVDSIDFPQTLETHETTVFTKTSKTYIVGLKDGTFSVGGPWDDATLDPHMDSMLRGANYATSKTFEIGPEGVTSGDVKYSGECFITSYSGAMPVGDAVRWTADFQVTDDITRGTFA